MSVSLPSPRARRTLRRHEKDATVRDAPHSVVVLASAAAAIAWVPMLLLAVAERLVGGRPEATSLFLHDFTIHVRLLVAIPAMIVSDSLSAAAIQRCEEHLQGSGIVGSSERLRAGIETSRRVRGSLVVSVVIALLVFGIAIAAGSRGDGMAALANMETQHGASWAGVWHGFVAFPMFRFFLLRWLFHWLVWAGFLFWIKRLDLKLVATHPDRAGGLGFLCVPVSAAIGVVFGFSATAAMAWRNAVLSQVTTFGHVRIQAALLGAIWAVLLLAPLIVFAPRLLRLKRIALVEYSRLGHEYTQAFQDKWIRDRHDTEALLGTPDLQSLADLGTALDVVQSLRPTPIDVHLVLPVAIVYGISLLPAVLSQLSLEELLARLIKVVL